MRKLYLLENCIENVNLKLVSFSSCYSPHTDKIMALYIIYIYIYYIHIYICYIYISTNDINICKLYIYIKLNHTYIHTYIHTTSISPNEFIITALNLEFAHCFSKILFMRTMILYLHHQN